jgi:hypothetical protein
LVERSANAAPSVPHRHRHWSDSHWCSGGDKIGCDNGERVRITVTLDCCDREAIPWPAHQL